MEVASLNGLVLTSEFIDDTKHRFAANNFSLVQATPPASGLYVHFDSKDDAAAEKGRQMLTHQFSLIVPEAARSLAVKMKKLGYPVMTNERLGPTRASSILGLSPSAQPFVPSPLAAIQQGATAERVVLVADTDTIENKVLA